VYAEKVRFSYPLSKPWMTGLLPTGDGHFISYDQAGSSKGVPIVIIHGGPGCGRNEYKRQLFNPDDWWMISYDQRGCGASQPRLSLHNNTTSHLIEDLERLREELDIEQWALYGGSWGTTLALAYAQAYPERVLGIVLRGVFLCRDRDIAWLFGCEGAARLYPDHFARFAEGISMTGTIEERNERILNHYGQQLHDRASWSMAAKRWADWEYSLAEIAPGSYDVPFSEAEEVAVLEHHYLSRRGFLEENQLLDNMGTIGHIPTAIVHGRHDMVVPAEQAWELHQALPSSRLHIVEGGGHGGFSDEMVGVLTEAIGWMAEACRVQRLAGN
jgi:proline iminopeptidase